MTTIADEAALARATARVLDLLKTESERVLAWAEIVAEYKKELRQQGVAHAPTVTLRVRGFREEVGRAMRRLRRARQISHTRRS
jgi:hypothetical protein